MAQNIEDIMVGPESQVAVDSVDMPVLQPGVSDAGHLSLVNEKTVSKKRSDTMFLWLFLPLAAVFFVLV